MNLILGSIDGSVFDPNSALRARVREYAAQCEHLDVLCITRMPVSEKIVREGNLQLIALTAPKPLAALQYLRTSLRLARLRGRTGTLISAQDPFILGMLSLTAARLARIPLHVQVHIDFFSPYFRAESRRQKLEAFLAPFVLRRAERIRVVSQKIAAYCTGELGIPAEHIDIIPIRSTLEKYQTAEPKRFADVLVAARLVKQKNIPLAIGAFARIAHKHPSLTLGIVGSGPEERALRARIAALANHDTSLTERISFLPWSAELASLMKGAKAFVLSSDYEGWGMTIVEACAAGTPVVMADVGCAGEFAIDGVNARIVPVRDTAALAAALDEVLSSSELQKTLKNGAAESISKLPSAESYTRAIVASWNHALHPGSS